MVIKGRVVWDKTNEPLEGASITLINATGKYLGIGIAADNNGIFSLDSNAIVPGVLVKVTYQGFEPLLVDPYDLTSVNIKTISLTEESEEAVIFRARNRKGWILFVICSAVGVSAQVYQIAKTGIRPKKSKPNLLSLIQKY